MKANIDLSFLKTTESESTEDTSTHEWSDWSYISYMLAKYWYR